MRRLAIAVVVVAIAGVVALRGLLTRSDATFAESAAVSLDEADNGGTVSIKFGGRLIIGLASNPSTGFTWSIVEKPPCLDERGSRDAGGKPSGNNVGVPGRRIFEFAGNGTCSGKLKFEYRRSWEKDVAAAKTFEVFVRVD